MCEKTIKYTHRHLVRCVIEAVSPLAVGSGESDVLTDALVAKDANGLPYIPATSIAGVVRGHMQSDCSEAEKRRLEDIFGYQASASGKGSDVIFSEAKIVGSDGRVIDGLQPSLINDDEFLARYRQLPIRQHVRINSKGVADNAGKFDEQVVFAGTRFCFEIELLSDTEKNSFMDELLNTLFLRSFRLGGGTRSGYGEIKVVELKVSVLNLANPADLEAYLSKSSSLENRYWTSVPVYAQSMSASDEKMIEYELVLKPQDFVLFSSGFGDDEADMAPVTESKVVWTDKGQFKDDLILVPASSVKGALSHRVAYHWNLARGYYAGDPNAKVGSENPAVRSLFGYEDTVNKVQVRGNVFLSDVYVDTPVKNKVLSHVSIDRFTGGARNGALYQEKAAYVSDANIRFGVAVFADACADVEVKNALEAALRDICDSRLPLGGGVNRGNGLFSGEITCNGKTL